MELRYLPGSPAAVTEPVTGPERPTQGRHPRAACEDPQVGGGSQREPARRPEDLSQFFVDRANAGDVEGLVALYEPDAVLAMPTGDAARGKQAIRAAFQQMLAGRPVFTADPRRPALRNGELALTWTRLPDGATAEIARRQPDGTWLWTVDQPYIIS